MALRILVVDDTERIRTALTHLLSNFDMEVESTASAEEAFRKVTFAEYDVVIMDLNMPGLNGIEGIRSIRTIREGQRIIVLTGLSERRVREEAEAAGADIFLVKPAGVKQLVESIRSLVESVEEEGESDE